LSKVIIFNLAAKYLSDCQIWRRHVKPQLSYYDWKIFTRSILTLDFNLDLSKLNSEIWHRRRTPLPNFTIIGLVDFEKSQRVYSQRTNEPTNQQKARVIRIHPGEIIISDADSVRWTTWWKHIGKTLFLFTAAIHIATWSTVNKRMTTASDIIHASPNSSPPVLGKGSGCDLPGNARVRRTRPGCAHRPYIIANPVPCAPRGRVLQAAISATSGRGSREMSRTPNYITWPYRSDVNQQSCFWTFCDGGSGSGGGGAVLVRPRRTASRHGRALINRIRNVADDNCRLSTNTERVAADILVRSQVVSVEQTLLTTYVIDQHVTLSWKESIGLWQYHYRYYTASRCKIGLILAKYLIPSISASANVEACQWETVRDCDCGKNVHCRCPSVIKPYIALVSHVMFLTVIVCMYMPGQNDENRLIYVRDMSAKTKCWYGLSFIYSKYLSDSPR